jgi:hypothetical protein
MMSPATGAALGQTVPGELKGNIVGLSQGADSDEVARAFRDDVARYSDMTSPRAATRKPSCV